MYEPHSNHTILVNWGVGNQKARAFGCAKACEFCNWRGWDGFGIPGQHSSTWFAASASAIKISFGVGGISCAHAQFMARMLMRQHLLQAEDVRFSPMSQVHELLQRLA